MVVTASGAKYSSAKALEQNSEHSTGVIERLKNACLFIQGTDRVGLECPFEDFAEGPSTLVSNG